MVLDPRDEALHNVHTELLVRKPCPGQITSKLVQIRLQLSKAYIKERTNNTERDSSELEQKKNGKGGKN